MTIEVAIDNKYFSIQYDEKYLDTIIKRLGLNSKHCNIYLKEAILYFSTGTNRVRTVYDILAEKYGKRLQHHSCPHKKRHRACFRRRSLGSGERIVFRRGIRLFLRHDKQDGYNDHFFAYENERKNSGKRNIRGAS